MEEEIKKWHRNPEIVVVGGGTGMSTLLKGIKELTTKLTAIVAVSDDGGGSGVLRNEMGILPPGDIRNCILALANAEPLMQQLLNYRFQAGTLRGQSFGNLFLAALEEVCGSFEEGVRRMSEILNVTGRVLPVTTSDVYLRAEFENGTEVLGESKIFHFKKEQNCRISRVSLVPSKAKPLPEAIEAIRRADMIVLGPGSLYTSVIPNLLVPGISEEIAAARAFKLYCCNVMTEYCETDDYTAYEHLEALVQHSCPGIVDAMLVNTAPFPEEVLQKYAAEGAEPALVDRERIVACGVELYERDLLSTVGTFARHDSRKLAAAILDVYEQYIREHV